jgi:hypothetical protein
MILIDNSVRKMHLLNTQLNFHIKSFNYFIFFNLPHKTICRKYVIKKIIHDLFHFSPRLCLRRIWESREGAGICVPLLFLNKVVL